ncbi:1121_t:CDS:2, partial [Dentiscutata erythropus]
PDESVRRSMHQGKDINKQNMMTVNDSIPEKKSYTTNDKKEIPNSTTPTTKEKTITKKKSTELTTQKKALNLRQRKNHITRSTKSDDTRSEGKTPNWTTPTTKKEITLQGILNGIYQEREKKHRTGRHQRRTMHITNDKKRNHIARNTERDIPGTRKETPNWTTPTTNDAHHQNRRTI